MDKEYRKIIGFLLKKQEKVLKSVWGLEDVDVMKGKGRKVMDERARDCLIFSTRHEKKKKSAVESARE